MKEHNHFGMDPKDVVLFEQRMIPCLDNDGKVIRESADKVARAPDGNGGLYWALRNEGVLEAMAERGIKYVHVYCVDNVLVKVADPLFVGYCIDKGAEAGNKVVEKAFPDEAVGVVCKVNDRIQGCVSAIPSASQYVFQCLTIFLHFEHQLSGIIMPKFISRVRDPKRDG